MVLYLFLVVVGDRGGRSFYADSTIMEILRLGRAEFSLARQQLTEEGLIDYQRPYWWVKNIQGGDSNAGWNKPLKGRTKAEGNVCSGCHGTELPSDRGDDRDFAEACLKDISRILSG